ncbi:uncharacterized protein [Ptychodera flava]|uniref:uncharacterized protein n=1 Tax=Ptychodera flava TaxID=63121 RepID=UPI00396A6943
MADTWCLCVPLVFTGLVASGCIAAAGVFVSLEIYIEIKCLEQHLSNVNCNFTDLNDSLISHEFAREVQILEPVLSVVVVTLSAVFYILCYKARGTCNVLGWFSVFKHSWFMKRFIALLFVMFYYFYVYVAAENAKQGVNDKRYLVLPFGVLTWFILLTVSNENGPLSWAARQCCGAKLLSFLLFLFAALTNAAEFAIVSVYITKTIWTIFVTEKNEDLVNVIDALGMTVTIALRFDFTNVFSDMANLSLKDKQYGGKWKLLHDRWDDWPDVQPKPPKHRHPTASGNVEPDEGHVHSPSSFKPSTASSTGSQSPSRSLLATDMAAKNQTYGSTGNTS